MPPVTVPPPVEEGVERLAWRGLMAAAAWARGPAATTGPAFFAADDRAGLVAVDDGRARAWLGWDPARGWTVQPGAPAGVRGLLELYLPVCRASAARPVTIAHLGQSLDGYIATATGDSYYVTGPENVRHLHRLRALCDAVLVGAGTVARDDPQLTVRLVEGGHPLRVVLDPGRRLAATRRVFAGTELAKTLWVVAEGKGAGTVAPDGVEILEVACDSGGRLRLDALLSGLRARGLVAVFVEGGGTTVSRFVAADLVDRLQVAVAPLLTGAGRPGLTLAGRDEIADCWRPQHRVFRMGADVLFDCDMRSPADPEPAAGLERIF